MKESGGDRLKSTIYESTLSPADAVLLPQWGRQRGGGFAVQKRKPPRLAALGSPFQGKGLAWILPPSYGRRCPEGAEVGWGKRDEKERGRLSQAGDLREYPSAAGEAFLPHARKATIREYRFPHNVRANTRICGKRITTDKAFPAWGRWRA